MHECILPVEVQEHILGFVDLAGRDWLPLRLVNKHFNQHLEQLFRQEHESRLEDLFTSLYIKRKTRNGDVPFRMVLRLHLGCCTMLPTYKCGRCFQSFGSICEKHECRRSRMIHALYGPALVLVGVSFLLCVSKRTM
jgi:hypothetical protein